MEWVPKKYSVRSGTQESGRLYEYKITTLLSLRSIGEDTEDMWILSNAGECRDFDDVVLYRKTKPSNKTIYLIQLKHQDIGKDLLLKQFTAEKGKFSLAKYSKSLCELKTDIENGKKEDCDIVKFLRTPNLNLVFVLYTNKNIQIKIENNQNSNQTNTPLLKVEDNENYVDVINTNNGTIYKFNYANLDLTLPDDLRSYHDNFYLFVNQVDINHIDELILNEIRKLFANMKLSEEILKETARKYVDFITQWATGKLGRYYPLTKMAAVNKLTEIIFTNYVNIKQFNSTEYNLKSKSLSVTDWKSILREVPITVVHLDFQIRLLLHEYIYREIYFACPKLPAVKLWDEDFSSEAQASFYKDYEKLKEDMLRTIGNFGKITLMDVYKCLRKTGQIPLVLEADDIVDYGNIMEAIRFLNKSTNISFIIMIDTNKNELPKINGLPNIFINLDDLSGGKKKKILRKDIKLQDKFSHVGNRIEKELYVHITVKDIIDILLGSFTVGNHFQKLPIYFINRYVTKIIIKPNVLMALNNDLFMIKCDASYFRSFAENNKLKFENMRALDRKKFFGNLLLKNRKVISFDCQQVRGRKPVKKKYKSCHELMLAEDKYLEWLKSTPTIQDIKDFRDNSEMTYNYYKIDNNYLNNKISLISAGPGMGKSMLMDYIALKISETKWVLKINLNEHLDYYEKKEFRNSRPEVIEYLCYFNKEMLLKHKCYNVLNEEIFRRYARAGDVVVILDGFDEISMRHKKEVTQLAKCLRSEIYSMWITTRPSMKSYLEENFGVFSITLNLFNESDQIDFLAKFYFNSFDRLSILSMNVTREVINDFVLRLLETTKKKLNRWDYEFTGIPLQTKLLAEVFKVNCIEYVQTKHFTLTEHFDLLYLYEEFINQKSKIFAEKVHQTYAYEFPVVYEKFQKLYALKILFKGEDLEALNVESKLRNFTETIDKAIEFIQKDGIIVAEDEININFVHRTFAEYLAAKWIYENCLKEETKKFSQSLLKKTFEPSYQVLRNIFDRMMAKNLELHKAIINQQFDKVKEIVETDARALTVTDLGGRTALHIAASWGFYHPRETTVLDNEDNSVNPMTRFISENSLNRDPMVDIVYLLLKCPDRKDTIFQSSPLDYAVISSSLAVLNIFLEKSKKPTFLVPEILMDFFFYYGCSLNYLSLIRHIFEQLKDRFKIKRILNTVRYENITLIQCAARNGHLKVLSELLKNGTEVNLVDINGCTALHTAVDCNQIQAIAFLLYNGANVNQGDNNGNTSLHYAARTNNLEALRLVLSYRPIEVDTVNNKDETSLHTAARFSDTNILELLIDYDADIHKRDHKGRAVLHKAIDSQTVNNLSFFLSKEGVDVNLKDGKGRTALHKAAKRNNLSATEFLVKAGANYLVTDNKKLTPLKLARTVEAFDVIVFLEKYKR